MTSTILRLALDALACGSTSCSPLTTHSDAADGSSSSSCTIVLASDYDQSCTFDSDCVEVGEVPSCPAQACDFCTTTAVNKSAATQYAAALQKASASTAGGLPCGCPCEGTAICREGKCQAGFCAPPPGDTLPACADAGGRCSYSANTTCNGVGPADACAYSDEVCCLN